MAELSRRSLLKAIPALFAMPAIVKASSLMTVKAVPPSWPYSFNKGPLYPEIRALLERRMREAEAVMVKHMSDAIYGPSPAFIPPEDGLAQYFLRQVNG
jgi:hypothetical protein